MIRVKNKFYRITALLIAVIMILSISIPVFAETTTSNTSTSDPPTMTDLISREPGTLLERAIAYLIGGIAQAFLAILKLLIGTPDLTEVIFTKEVNATDPFSAAQFQTMNYWYEVLIYIGVVIMFISVIFLAFNMIFAGFSPKHKDEVKERIERLFFVGIIIAVTPIAFRLLLYTNNAMTYYIYRVLRLPSDINSLFDPAFIFANIKTGNPILTAVGILVMAFINFRVAVVFVLRKFMLMIFYIFTPIAATLWSINKDITAAKIWLGELLTNIFTQFFYALVFAFYFSVTGIANTASGVERISGSFESIVWLYLLIYVAEALRQSLQGYFTRLAGVDELGIAGRIAGVFGASSAVTSAATLGAQFAGAAAGKIAAGKLMSNVSQAAVGGMGGVIAGSSAGSNLAGSFNQPLSFAGGPSGSSIGGSSTGSFSQPIPFTGGSSGGSGGSFSASSSNISAEGFASAPQYNSGSSSSPMAGAGNIQTLPTGEKVTSSGIILPPGVDIAQGMNKLNVVRSSSNTPTGGVLAGKEANNADVPLEPHQVLAKTADKTANMAHYASMFGSVVDHSLGTSKGPASFLTKSTAAAVGMIRGYQNVSRYARAQGITQTEALKRVTGVKEGDKIGGLKAVKRFAHVNVSAAFSGGPRAMQNVQRFHNTSLDGYRWKA
ncbi:hypothetical protein [Thermoanaerobacter pentosaceus]|uniref:Uncharacterized protein n=1 Tax=Thermoanaerobacter pentosaceus TaxID=694059 RepID=A0ABT9M2J6_9THEO|nr:hypothetical protein [Thermoanaerobacter pentosaceus]MDP9750358.1 hypothetical protein [Thermoanaerobacter pentosaceus]